MLQGIPGLQDLDNLIGDLAQPVENGNVPQQQDLPPQDPGRIPEEE
jgi:hypothetical protein